VEIMPLPQEKLYTTEDIYLLPDGERAELIDGQIYYMAPPSRWHQEISMELGTVVNNYIKKKQGSCKVYSAPYAVFLKKDNRTYVEPDISVICDKNKLNNEKGCFGAPDWIIEIVSPSSIKMDYLIKMLQYEKAGVREYWIVDPLKKRIIVYNFELQDMNEYTFADTIKAGIYEDLEIDFSTILS
jgi:Uma2 family endonuclease